jgi:hypothetical protein
MRPTHIELFFNFLSNNQSLIPSVNVEYKEKIALLKKYTDWAKGLTEDTEDYMEVRVIEKFLEKPNQIYKLCEDFSKDLYRVNLDIPTKIIPDVCECVLIEFPDWFEAQNSDGSHIHSCYIYQDLIFNGVYNKKCRTLRLLFPDFIADGSITGFNSYIWINLETEKNISECLNIIDNEIKINKDAILFALKTYIYVHSGEPDLREMKAVEIPTTKKEKKLRHFMRDNVGNFFDFTYLGYFYKKQRYYNVDGFEVSGHMRWQRYGIGNIKTKLIWIDPFYKSNLKTRESVIPSV